MELKVNTMLSYYKVIIEKGSINNLNDYLKFEGKVMIISDDGVPFEYINIVKSQFPNSYVHLIKQGETSKSIENFVKIHEDLLANNFSRKDMLIALGGGVVGDLTGFVASTYKRGINYIQIPTTSLAQIDSSIGGKTAIDIANYKNVVGSFYQPSLVVIDANTLKTLPKRHLFNGLVEALKIGLTLDNDLVKLFEKDNFLDDLELIIAKAVELKKEIVEKDEKELNERKVLNFGHTIGHAIESLNLGSLLHGECVAKGMLYFIEDENIKERVKTILRKLEINLNTNEDSESLIKYIRNDKKALADKVTIVSVKEIGKYQFKELSFDDIESLLKKEV